jgi:hypothetical protein
MLTDPYALKMKNIITRCPVICPPYKPSGEIKFRGTSSVKPVPTYPASSG